MKPRARKTITTGMSVRMYGKVDLSWCPSVRGDSDESKRCYCFKVVWERGHISVDVHMSVEIEIEIEVKGVTVIN